MTYITGDCHAKFDRFSTKQFPDQKGMTKDDYVIICGDFGGVWNHSMPTPEENYWLDWLNDKPFTTLFVDGNHENFDRLKDFPRKKWNGGMVHEIRPSVLHLMRGYVFNLDGKKFFTFGGAKSHDIQDGILDPKNYKSLSDLVKDYNFRTFYLKQMLRINHYSWWADELPATSEMKRGIKNLQKVDFKVDYVISHCLPLSVINVLYSDDSDRLTRYFDSLINEYGLDFKRWFAGHYHTKRTLFSKYEIHYEDIERILQFKIDGAVTLIGKGAVC